VSVDELIQRARPLVEDGRVPSRSTLQKTLRTRWDRVVAVHQALTEEADLALQARRDRRAAMLARRRTRKPVTRQLVARPTSLTVVPPAAVSPLLRPAAGEAAAPLPSPPRSWPILLLALPAFVAIWAGWVDLGRLTGFGVVHPFPGIWDEARLNTAITLPIGLETYAAYALYVWLSAAVPAAARRFARWSAIGSLTLGAAGQIAYHLMIAAGMERAPWQITTVVACLPVAVLGMGAALRHLVHAEGVPS
jgi:hypothetical protein